VRCRRLCSDGTDPLRTGLARTGIIGTNMPGRAQMNRWRAPIHGRLERRDTKWPTCVGNSSMIVSSGVDSIMGALSTKIVDRTWWSFGPQPEHDPSFSHSGPRGLFGRDLRPRQPDPLDPLSWTSQPAGAAIGDLAISRSGHIAGPTRRCRSSAGPRSLDRAGSAQLERCCPSAAQARLPRKSDSVLEHARCRPRRRAGVRSFPGCSCGHRTTQRVSPSRSFSVHGRSSTRRILTPAVIRHLAAPIARLPRPRS